MSEEQPLDPVAAAALLRQTSQQAGAALRVRLPLLYLIWGAAWLIGLGAMWLSAHGQHPYRGPSGGSSAVLGVLIVAATVSTALVAARATGGIGGTSAQRWRIYGLSWPVGFGAVFTIFGAVAHLGAGPRVMGVLYACGPFLVTGLIYLLGAAITLDQSMFWLGIWLALVGAVGAWTGPVTVLAIGAVAGGGGFLVAAFLCHQLPLALPVARQRGSAGYE